MARKKIKLITFDLDDTVWPNKKVILDAEKALWNFLVLKVPQLKENFNENSINKIRVNLVEQDPSLKFNLTKFRKEVVKELLLSLGLDTNEASFVSKPKDSKSSFTTSFLNLVKLNFKLGSCSTKFTLILLIEFSLKFSFSCGTFRTRKFHNAFSASKITFLFGQTVSSRSNVISFIFFLAMRV